MSCNCKNTEGVVAKFSCPCDKLVHPLPLKIGAGLDHLPRQIAHFPEFRRAMLASSKEHPALFAWRARKEDDLGVMLLEMWAYICDSLSFYDEVLANEAYLRTAQLRPSLRRLVALIGYLPSPAVASTVQLAAFADGRIPIKLPLGTSFRSGAFDGNPPQVFELDSDTWIHPLTNKWSIKPPVEEHESSTFSFLILPKAEIKQDNFLLLLSRGNSKKLKANYSAILTNINTIQNITINKTAFKTAAVKNVSSIFSNLGSSASIAFAQQLSKEDGQGLKVRHLETQIGKDGKQYTQLVLQSPAHLPTDSLLTDMRLMKPAHTIGLWTVGTTKSVDGVTLILKNLVSDIKIGDDILVTHSSDVQWFKIVSVNEVMRQDDATTTININGSTFNIPKISTPTTQITLNASIPWNDSQKNAITVHYGMQDAGNIIQETKTSLSNKDLLEFEGVIETPVDKLNWERFFLQDKNLRGVAVGARLDFSDGQLILNQNEGWKPELTLPVYVYGNVLQTSRGERVENEILGSGNAALSNQTFKLKKKPLTYLLEPTASNEQGISNTLKIYVNGILWKEVANFYGKKPHEQVYIVRQNDEQDSFITFGDGIRGERLPSGVDNIVCSYRFGAGRASPPAGSINQIGKPVKDLQSVKNPVAATGGADAETADNMRTSAPKSALILGRVVSIQDMEAVALAFPGVRSVQTEWRWDGQQQQAAVHIWYVGEAGIETKLMSRLKAIKDPTTPIKIEQAQPVTIALAVTIQIDPRYVETTVLAEVRSKLLNPKNGKLIPEQVGIGKPFYRSKLFADILSIEGTESISSVFWNKHPLSIFAVTPGAGHYFDFEKIGILLNGK